MCATVTWTETHAEITPRASLTERARREACRRVGQDGHSVAAVATDFGVGWATIMACVREHGRPLVDDPARLDAVHTLGVDETAFLAATATRHTTDNVGRTILGKGCGPSIASTWLLTPSRRSPRVSHSRS